MFFFFVIFFLSQACRQKTGNKEEDFFPLLPFILNDISDVDTNLYPIMKIVTVDSITADTFFVKREEFRGLAEEFLHIPDLTNKKYKNLFT